MSIKPVALLFSTILLAWPCFTMAQPIDSNELELSRNAASELNIEDIQERLQSVVNSDSLEAGRKSALIALYQAANESLQAARIDKARADELGNALISAAQERNRILAEPNTMPMDAQAQDFSLLGSEQLDTEIVRERSHLAALQGGLEEQRAAVELLRNEQTQSKIAVAETELLESENADFSTGVIGDKVVLEAQTITHNARRAALRAKINLLDQQIISYDSRLELAQLKAKYLEDKKNASFRQLQALEAASLQRKNEHVDASIDRIKELEKGIDTIPVEIREYLTFNKEHHTRLLSLVTLKAQQAKDNVKREAELERLKSAYTTLTEQLRVAGFNISPRLATALRKESEELAKLARKFSKPDKALQQQMIDVRLEQIELDSLLAKDQNAATDQLQASLTADAPGELIGFIQQLVVDRIKILNDLHKATGDYATTLAQTQSLNINSRITYKKYSDLVEERLFWVPSTATVKLSDLQKVWNEARVAFSVERVSRGIAQISTQVGDAPWRYVLASALAFALLLAKPRLLNVLKATRNYVGKVEKDNFRFTLQALLVTVLLSLPITLALLLSAWLASLADELQWLAVGLKAAASIYILLATFYQLCRPGGVAELHFKWQVRTVQLMRRHLRRLIRVLVPAAIVTNATANGYGDATSDTLGIVAFVIASLAISVFFHHLLHPAQDSEPVDKSSLLRNRSGFTSWLLYGLGVSLPAFLALLALIGYYYTAVQLEGRLFMSAGVIFLAIVIFYLAVRLLAISERRIKFRRLLSERRAQHERQDEREQAEQSGEAIPDNLDLGDLDLDTVGEQTRSLARLTIMVGCAWALWTIWSSLLPALGIFDDIVLWQISSGAEGDYELKNITLGVVGIAILWVIITVLATRNLPALLNMVFLNRMEFDAGTNYAIVTIVKYVVTITGVFVVCYLLGAQWSKLQWLVAAMGVGLGFGLQEIVANFISGILILFERKYRKNKRPFHPSPPVVDR